MHACVHCHQNTSRHQPPLNAGIKATSCSSLYAKMCTYNLHHLSQPTSHPSYQAREHHICHRLPTPCLCSTQQRRGCDVLLANALFHPAPYIIRRMEVRAAPWPQLHHTCPFPSWAALRRHRSDGWRLVKQRFSTHGTLLLMISMN